MLETKASGIALFRYTEDQRHELLLVAPYGKFGFPKGHSEEGESALQAAIREVDEEVPGLDYEVYEDVKPLVYTLETSGDNRAPEWKTVTIFLGELVGGFVDAKGNVNHNWENKQAKFFPVEDIKNGEVQVTKSARDTVLKAIQVREQISG